MCALLFFASFFTVAVSEAAAGDPFGSVVLTTTPYPLYPGGRNARLDVMLSYPKTDGSQSPLYDVNCVLVAGWQFSLFNDSFFLGVLSPGSSGLAVFFLDVAGNASRGEVDLDLVVSYREGSPQEPLKEVVRVLKLLVERLPDDPFGPLIAAVEPGPLYPGVRNARLNVGLGNMDRNDLYGVNLTISPPPQLAFRGSSSFLGVMSPGLQQNVSFIFDVAEGAAAGAYRVSVNVEYAYSPAGETRRVGRELTVVVEAQVDPFGPLTVVYYPYPLVPFAVNTSLYVGVSNAWTGELHDVSLELKLQEPFASASNASRLGMLAPGAREVADFHLNVGESAAPGEYQLGCVLTYRFYPWGELKGSTRLIKLLVGSVSSDPFGGLTVQVEPSLLTPGTEAARLSVTVTNPGAHLSGVLYDVSLLLDAEPSLSLRNNSYRIGTMEKGASTTGVFMLNVTGDAAPGEHLLGLVLQYRLEPSSPVFEAHRVVKLRIVPQPASLVVESILNEVEPGGNSTITFKVANRGGESAESFIASLTSPQDSPVRPLGSEFYAAEVRPGEVISIPMMVVVDRDTRGNYPLVLRLRYVDSANAHEQESHLTVQVLGGINPLVQVSRTEQSPERVMAGSTFLQGVSLVNVGESEARLVQVSLNVSYPFAVNGSASNLFVGNLKPGEGGNVALQILVDKNALVAVYSIPFTITYKDVYAEEYVQSGALGVQVLGAPRLYVESVTVEPSPLKPGQEGLLSVGVTNVGNDVAYDATIRVFGAEGILASSFGYIARLGERPTDLLQPLQRRTETAQFPVSVDRRLEAGVYLINITLAYRDDSGNAYGQSKLFEVELLPLEPFVPYLYLGLAGGVAGLSLLGYLLYVWEPQEPLGGASGDSPRRTGGRSLGPRRARALAVVACAAIAYALLVVPFIVHSNLDNAGVVTLSEEVGLSSLPEGVREICVKRGIERPVLLLVEHPKPRWVTLVVTSRAQAQAIPSSGMGVEVSDYVARWYVDWRDFQLVDQTFERFAVANVKQLGPFESVIEGMLLNPLSGILFEASRAVFYAGPLLLVLGAALLFEGRLGLWDLPAGLALYSFEVWCVNTLASQHNLFVAQEWRYFGYLFAAMLPLALYLWHFERSPGGRVVAWKMRALSRMLGLYSEPE